MRTVIWVLLATIISSLFFLLVLAWQVELGRIRESLIVQDFVKIIKAEHDSEKILDIQYVALKADFCGFNEDKDHFLFKYILKNSLNSQIGAIESLFHNELNLQHQRLNNDTMCAQ